MSIINHSTQRPHLQRLVVSFFFDDVEVGVVHATTEGGADVGYEGGEAMGEGVVEGWEGCLLCEARGG